MFLQWILIGIIRLEGNLQRKYARCIADDMVVVPCAVE
jgi:hypothetical protein